MSTSLKDLKISPMIYPGTVKFNKDLNEHYLFRVIEKVTGITEEEMISKSRRRDFVEARFIFFYCMRKYSKVVLKSIGNMLQKDHSSVVYGARELEKLIEQDKTLATQLRIVEKYIQQGSLNPNKAETVKSYTDKKLNK
jgi:chromosomal replication initiator protein